MICNSQYQAERELVKICVVGGGRWLCVYNFDINRKIHIVKYEVLYELLVVRDIGQFN
jgi:hypothetical protein